MLDGFAGRRGPRPPRGVWGELMSLPLRLFPFRRLLLLLVLALAAALLSLPSAESARASAALSVPSDWEHIPEGIRPGDSFRLLFVTSATRDASSSNIGDYNAHVQSAAGSNDSLESFKGQFRALISTSAVDAKENTGTTGTGVPIHWLGGDKVADDYADLYDKSWDSVSGKTESGSSYTGLVWTGGNKMGEKSGQRYAGAADVRLGDLADATLALSSPTVKASGEAYPLYALSPVITVAEPEPTPTPTSTSTPTSSPTSTSVPDNGPPTITSGPVIASNPASGDTYTAGETIEVSYTFSEAVTVTGAPRVRLFVGERKRWAHYSHAQNDGTTLVFAYVVRSDDRDENGVKVGRNQLKLRGGNIADADGNAADLKHPALSDQAGHRVDGADSPGRVILNTDQPEVGRAVTAGILDPDGDATGIVLDLGALRRPNHVGDHRRRNRSVLHPVRRRRGPIPAGERHLHRPPGPRQDSQHDHGQPGVRAAGRAPDSHSQRHDLLRRRQDQRRRYGGRGIPLLGVTFSACVGQNCTPPGTGRVAWDCENHQRRHHRETGRPGRLRRHHHQRVGTQGRLLCLRWRPFNGPPPSPSPPGPPSGPPH